MKKILSSIALIAVFLTGLSLLLYPTLSEYWHSWNQTRTITAYVEQTAQLDQTSYDTMWQAAVEYNASMPPGPYRSRIDTSQQAVYESLLDVSGDGIMGYIEIPVIDCMLPICHGTNETVMQTSVGHLAGSSLPVGGLGSHCVLSGHRGLPSAELFTRLNEVEIGDVFFLHVLDTTLSYEVDQILVVEPEEVQALAREQDKDYCTLMTCTPYGVNSHRLLVRGTRVENASQDQEIRVTADALRIEPVMVAPLLLLPLLVVLLLAALLCGGRKGGTHRRRGPDIHKT